MITPILEFFVAYARNTTPVKMLLQVGIFVFMITWLAVVVLFTTNFQMFADMYTRYQSENSVQIENALAVSEQVNDLLQDQQVRLGVDRIYVSRFHNGKVDLAGIHFIFFSRVAEATGDGVSNELTTTQNLPLSIFPAMLSPLAQGQCYYVDHVNSSIENTSFLQEMGVNSMIACPIFDTFGRLMGIVGVDGVVDQINTQEATNLQNSLQTLSGVLGGLLTTG